ncbi:hypothetical protein I3842_09G080800 [Carya illinoinensis]|uniref:Gnk2-homologous domain-containing protein n=1 Tax=Carya illinoinensis TaxID=32201 RepID=A0A922E286_CARIL|nr:hypothetical protein I3842_09G080800 [Carya illinoinensis]
MSSNTKIDYGFYNFTAGENADKVNAIAFCRGDVTLDVCRSCINSTSQYLLQSCPNQKEAINWPDKCSVRYSNRSIFGVMETQPMFTSKTIYALLECTPDWNSLDCTSCLEQLVGYMSYCCNGLKVGGKFVTPSCDLRYEIYSFYNPTAESPPPSPPPPPIAQPVPPPLPQTTTTASTHTCLYPLNALGNKSLK